MSYIGLSLLFKMTSLKKLHYIPSVCDHQADHTDLWNSLFWTDLVLLLCSTIYSTISLGLSLKFKPKLLVILESLT